LPCSFSLAPYASVADAATVTLGWDKNSEPDIAGYRMYYGTTSDRYDYSVDVGNYTSCTISGLQEGTTYYFSATAYNSNNFESDFSEELAYKIPVSDLVDGEGSNPVTIWLEAEDGYLNAPIEVFQDSNASGNNYIQAPDGSGNVYNPDQNGGYADYSFRAPVTGNYAIWGRVLATTYENNSFFISVDEGDYALWDTQQSQSWVWDKVSNRAGVDPVVYYLEAGEHTLIIKQREAGTKIDKILITSDLEFVPE
jgi:hypothetical protein